MRKLPAWCLFGAVLFVSLLAIRSRVLAGYEYERSVSSYWSLSEKASTIQQKSEYLDLFIKSLKTERFAAYDAIWLQTPDNSFEQNLKAVESLQGRMHEIIGMDPNSFQYQTAMQQITQQEMTEAVYMLNTFEGTWYLEHYPLFWDWLGSLTAIGLFVGGLLGLVAVVTATEF